MKKIWIAAIALVLLLASLPLVHAAPSDNGVPYDTYAEDSNGQLIASPPAYLPIASYRSLLDYELKNPEDLCIDGEGNLYIADTGNARVLIVSPGLTLVRSVGESVLNRPTGVHVSSDGTLYVADFGAEKVYAFDRDGVLIHGIEKPTSPMFGQNTPFRPSKIDGDDSGNLYILSEGTYQGLIQLDESGAFLGFFGANPSKVDLRVIVLQAIFSDAIVDNFIKITPQTMTDVVVDQNNRIYTITRGASGNAVKRLNISGINRLPSTMNDGPTMHSIAVGPIGNIYAIDDLGIIREFDAEGHLLFQFGGLDQRSYQTGLFTTPSAIAVDDTSHLYVLDKAKNELQVFQPTQYGQIVHDAVELYQRGDYLESKAPWEAVLAKNALFDLAHKGIGEAQMKAGDYRAAMASFRLAGDREGYSQAFWEVRNEWLSNHLSTVILLFVLLYVVALVAKKPLAQAKTSIGQALAPVSNSAPGKTLKHVFTMIRHPLDGFEAIKRDRIVSPITAVGLYVLLFVEALFALVMEGFPFNTRDLSNVSLVSEAVTLLGPLLLVVAANALVGAVNSGEGKWSDLFVGTIYSLSPFLVFWPLLTLLSRMLTYNEAFLYQASLTTLTAWSAILFFFMVKDMHHYSIAETIKSIVLTLFTIVMIIVSFLLLSSLAEQAFEFVLELFTEVFLRG
jgi:tetratricopeptide (TPR) repeat protein